MEQVLSLSRPGAITPNSMALLAAAPYLLSMICAPALGGGPAG